MSDIEKYPTSYPAIEHYLLHMAELYLRQAESAEIFYNEKVCDVHFITDKKLNYKSALLNINPNLIINTHHSYVHALMKAHPNDEYCYKLSSDVEEMLIALDKIAHKDYNESRGKL